MIFQRAGKKDFEPLSPRGRLVPIAEQRMGGNAWSAWNPGGTLGIFWVDSLKERDC